MTQTFTSNLWAILSLKVSSIGIPPLLLLSLDVIKCSMTVFCLSSLRVSVIAPHNSMEIHHQRLLLLLLQSRIRVIRISPYTNSRSHARKVWHLGRAPPNLHSSARNRKASLRRKPKIKTPIELSTPIFVEDKKGRLRMNTNHNLVAETLGLTERIA